jgi:hypothetical protein
MSPGHRAAMGLAAGLLAACDGAGPAETRAVEAAWFEECARAVGLDFEHTAGPQRYLFPEIMSGGVGLLDYDGDGWLDVFFVQGGDLLERGAPGHRLFHNLGDGSFEDVTASAGVAGGEGAGYGMGVACGDYDGDGDTDLYVTHCGPNVLYRNEGGGRFSDVTRAAGVADDGWSSSACFFDFDLDLDLDLFVVHYVSWDAARERRCVVAGREEQRDYCPPRAYDAPEPDTLFENLGDGTFTDASGRLARAGGEGNGLGVVSGDFDGDGRADLFVANDATPNQLWLQTPDGRFEDRALSLGCAVGGSGEARAGMGVVAADLEGDGDLDLFLSQLRGEPNTVYLQEDGLYFDRTGALGLSAPTRATTGFGLGVADFDHDGMLDVFVANGHVYWEEPLSDPRDPYAQPAQLFRGEPGPRFAEIEPRGGTAEPLVATGRGAAFGDLDNDGDVDVLVANRNGPAHYLRNRQDGRRAWVQFALRDARGRDADGAVVTLIAGGRVQARQAHPASSYLASNDPRVHFGLGSSERAEEVRVRWPGGREESFGSLPARALHVLREGQGQALEGRAGGRR